MVWHYFDRDTASLGNDLIPELDFVIVKYADSNHFIFREVPKVKEVKCIYCGHPNQADALFCEDCSRVLDDPGTLQDQVRKTYLEQEEVLITETAAFIYGKTYPIAEIQEVDITERKKDRRAWGVGMIVFGIGTAIEGLLEGDLAFSFACGVSLVIAGAVVAVVTKPVKEEMVSTLWITTEDGSEHSRGFDDHTEAETIKDAILSSCFDREGKAE